MKSDLLCQALVCKFRLARRKHAERQVELLLRHVLDLPPARPLPEQVEQEVVNASEEFCNSILLEHRPVELAIGYTYFMGHRFETRPDVIVPDPVTERLVLTTLRQIDTPDAPVRIAEVGTGVGAISIALAHALPCATLLADDLSPSAVTLARSNVRRHGLEDRITVIQGDGLRPFSAWPEFDIIVSNPPYMPIEARSILPPEVLLYAPDAAVFAADHGMQVYRELIAEAPRLLRESGRMCLEFADEVQERLLLAVADSGTFDLQSTEIESLGWGSVLVLARRVRDKR